MERDRITVIMVEPRFGLNIGYVARTMKNFGLKRLIITGIEKIPVSAFKFCSHARDIVENAELRNFKEVVKEFDLVIGTTAKGAARSSNVIRQTITPEEAITYIERSMSTALVLGRETIGLKNEELKECDIVVSIPTGTQYRTLNISHALAILLYVFLMKRRRCEGKNMPTKREREQLIVYINSILDVIDFPKHRRLRVLKTFNKLLMEASPSKEEIVTMLGFFRRTWIRLSRS